ncbi:hypothetical protein LCM20_06520 [Halobacillus litoralis]|uniref:hypothetical protein n=1 Tax=Halobacillus litoralis TaxID=45668 RepID=UPI001CD7EE5E|nr:hypothetical protein [Halobacillus litoralis]MCA0970235.1 hypothetical protein [Halobacillus litoralis]
MAWMKKKGTLMIYGFVILLLGFGAGYWSAQEPVSREIRFGFPHETQDNRIDFLKT